MLTADWITVGALDDHGQPVFVLVPGDADGVVRHDDWRGFGQRSTKSGTTEFNRVAVEPDQVLRRAMNGGSRKLFPPGSQLVHAAIDLGIARGAFEDCAAYVKRRARPWREANVERIVDERT